MRFTYIKIILLSLTLLLSGCTRTSFLKFKSHCKNFEENFKFSTENGFKLVFLKKSFSREDIVGILGGPGVKNDKWESYLIISPDESMEVSLFYKDGMLKEMYINKDASYFTDEIIIETYTNFGNGNPSLVEYSVSFSIPEDLKPEDIRRFFGAPYKISGSKQEYRFSIKGKMGILPAEFSIKIIFSENHELINGEIDLDNVKFF